MSFCWCVDIKTWIIIFHLFAFISIVTGPDADNYADADIEVISKIRVVVNTYWRGYKNDCCKMLKVQRIV